MLEAVLASALGEALGSTVDRFLWRQTSRRRLTEHDAAIALLFDARELINSTSLQIPLIPGFAAEDISAWLRSPETQGVLRELILTRLTSGSPIEIDRTRSNLRFACLDYFLDTNQEDVLTLADAVFYGLDFELKELSGRLEAAGPALAKDIRSAAAHGQAAATLQAISRHFEAHEGQSSADRVRDREFVRKYRLSAASEHGYLEPPDFEQRVRVSLQDLYVVPKVTGLKALRVDASSFFPIEVTHPGPEGEFADPEITGNVISTDQHYPEELLHYLTDRRAEMALAAHEQWLLAIGDVESTSFVDHDIWHLGDTLERTVLLGDPGGGKSTAAAALIHRFATDTSERVPFLVVLREFAREDPPRQSVVGYLESRLEIHYQSKSPAGLVERLLLSGKAAVFFDGLDELVDTRRRRSVSQLIENFCTLYPLAPMLVTSRRIGYDQARLDESVFTAYVLAPFSTEQATEYAAKWFRRGRQLRAAEDPDRWASAFIEESSNVPDLRTNPLMLALMCILYRGEGSLPRNRPAVYERCAILLFETWDASRRIHVDLRARSLVEPMLRYLAYWLFTRETIEPNVTEAQLLAETSGYLQGRRFEDPHEAMEAASEFVAFCRDRAWVFTEVGSNADGDALFTFTHRTFLEYFAAAHLSSISDTPADLADVLLPRIAKNEWDVVAQLAVQIKSRSIQDGASRFFDAVLNSVSQPHVWNPNGVLDFLVRTAELFDITPRTLRDLTDSCFINVLDLPAYPLHLEPLSQIMAICEASGRATVRQRLTELIAQTIASGPSGHRRTALMLATALDVFVGWTGGASAELEAFWASARMELIQDNRAALIEAAGTDNGLAIALIYYSDITLEELLAGRQSLDILFASAIFGVGGIIWRAPSDELFARLIGERSSFPAEGHRFVATFAAGCLSLGQPPWAARVNSAASLFNESRSTHKMPNLVAHTEDDWEAAGLLLAMEHERGRNLVAIEGTVFSPFLQYVSARNEDVEGAKLLPRLPVGEKVQGLLTAWAEGEISLLGSSFSGLPIDEPR